MSDAYYDLGEYRRNVTTSSSDAQIWFDRGLLWTYCFNPEEAIPLWQRMDGSHEGQAPPEFASTHPSAGTRIADLKALMPKALEYRKRFCDQP